MARFVRVKGFTDGIDPVLVPPVRMLIVATLVDQQWHEFAALRASLRLSPPVLSKQLTTLRAAGYLDTRPSSDGRRSSWRITDCGIDQLAMHLASWERLMSLASSAVRSARTNNQQ
ncbi:transcriptional regulator [Amycolatopsis sp. NPDC051372]|uniref:transcriptional regulator n=1 Tax=Amycolatopsis sp. NPDC051372 TaxID=3155669 RepID=UPI003435BEE6